MKRVGKTTSLEWLLACVMLAGGAAPAAAQFQPFASDNRFELSETVQLDRADSAVLSQLERVDACLDDEQWDEAIETLRRLMENSDGKLLGVTQKRYVGLRDWVHLRLASLPSEALKLYRGRVDPLAQEWYESGMASGERRMLERVVRQAFASSWGDDAMMALGEMALESGDYAAARWYWQRIVPAELPSNAKPIWPGYPDTQLDLAAVRARLVLVSILEGSTARAADDLAQFVRLHPDARGRLGGQEANYVEALRSLLAESKSWPAVGVDANWPTFAGSPRRNKIAPRLIDVGKVAWRVPLRKVAAAPSFLGASDTPPGAPRALLSYHPVLVGNLLLFNNRLSISALDVRTGQAAWGSHSTAIYRDELDGALHDIHNPPGTLGVPRFSMTVFADKLFARMGSSVTGRPQQSTSVYRPGYLVCLDLAAEGRLQWKITPQKGWTFEGSPLGDGANVYVGMRRNDIRPQAFVACFDAQTGKHRWRRFICGADTPAQGMLHESTHNLLTLSGEMLYYNTNLGAVAAIATSDGRLKWVSLYPRQTHGNLSKLGQHWRRDLNPCLYDRGNLLVAPADSPRVFAFDAASGQMLWQSGSELADVTHLLGASNDHLIAGGDKLYWIDLNGANAGRISHVWPQGREKLGYGRGLLAGDSVLWPTREKIYIFDQKTARQRKVIELQPRAVSGGNLLVAQGRLLIAGGTELVGFDIYAPTTKEKNKTIAFRGSQ